MALSAIAPRPGSIVQGVDMNDQTAQEPTMEEILASIRRIISEDDAPAEAASVEDDSEPDYTPELDSSFDDADQGEDDEVLELTEPYEAPELETIGDLDVADSSFEAEAPASAYAAASDHDSLVGETAAASAASAFAGLAASMQKPESVSAPRDLPFMSGNTVEDMVREMLRPMLKDWLDTNLPTIVEDQVRKEVERIARNAG